MVKLLLLSLICCLSGCTATKSEEFSQKVSAGFSTSISNSEPLRFKDTLLTEDTQWSGDIVIDGAVRVVKGKILTILPGTDITFVRRDADQDGLGDATLIIDGKLIARGSPAAPIRFRSAEDQPQPGDWLELHADFSPEIVLQFCEIRDSAYGLHAHFSKGVVEDCTIARNIDGTRLGRARFTLRRNLIEHNIGKGLNFRDSRLEIRRNIIRHNHTGIFLFEKDQDSNIQENNFYGNDLHLRLGDFFTGGLQLQGNWWEGASVTEANEMIYDQGEDPAIGAVAVDPATEWIKASGPCDRLTLVPQWQFGTDGFIDAPPLVNGGRIYIASWDGNAAALDDKGREIWSQALSEVVDAPMALANERLFAQTWGRKVFALDRRDGKLLWANSYAPSPVDDHRQGGLVAIGDQVLVPSWNGTLYALNQENGGVFWALDLKGALRSAPALSDHMFCIGTGRGKLVLGTLEGSILWQRELEEAILTTPAWTPDGLVVLTRDGNLAAFSPQGALRWRSSLNEDCFYAAPVHAGDGIFVATTAGWLYKMADDSGKILWRAELGGASYATPLVRSGRIFVGDNQGHLQVFDTDSGDFLTVLTVDGPIQGAPVYLQDRIIFGSRDGAVHAVEIIEEPCE